MEQSLARLRQAQHRKTEKENVDDLISKVQCVRLKVIDTDENIREIQRYMNANKKKKPGLKIVTILKRRRLNQRVQIDQIKYFVIL